MKIQFKNRYGNEITFVKLEKNKWIWRVNDPDELPWGFAMSDSKRLVTVDPPGGPCITVGQFLPHTELKVTDIKFEPYHVDKNGFEYFEYIIYTES